LQRIVIIKTTYCHWFWPTFAKLVSFTLHSN